jgi:hypothetical protein
MTRHAQLSYMKSGIRIFGYTGLFEVSNHPSIWGAAALLILAEIIGIVEEFGE